MRANIQQLQRSIPTATITKELVDSQVECAICFEKFYLNERGVSKLLCDHLYHARCLLPWLDHNASCPVCRAPANRTMFPLRLESWRMRNTLQASSHRLDILDQQSQSTSGLSNRSPTTTSITVSSSNITPQTNRTPSQTVLSSALRTTPNVSARANRTPPETVVSSARPNEYENSIRERQSSLNVNPQTNRTPPQTVVSSARSNEFENLRRSSRTSPNTQRNRRPHWVFSPAARTSAYINPARALRASQNESAQTNSIPPQTVESSARSNEDENRVRLRRESLNAQRNRTPPETEFSSARTNDHTYNRRS